MQAEEMVTVYVPYCKDRAASEELLASHRSYLNVRLTLCMHYIQYR